jgi:hypothetical protein
MQRRRGGDKEPARARRYDYARMDTRSGEGLRERAETKRGEGLGGGMTHVP